MYKAMTMPLCVCVCVWNATAAAPPPPPKNPLRLAHPCQNQKSQELKVIPPLLLLGLGLPPRLPHPPRALLVIHVLLLALYPQVHLRLDNRHLGRLRLSAIVLDSLPRTVRAGDRRGRRSSPFNGRGLFAVAVVVVAVAVAVAGTGRVVRGRGSGTLAGAAREAALHATHCGGGSGVGDRWGSALLLLGCWSEREVWGSRRWGLFCVWGSGEGGWRRREMGGGSTVAGICGRRDVGPRLFWCHGWDLWDVRRLFFWLDGEMMACGRWGSSRVESSRVVVGE